MSQSRSPHRKDEKRAPALRGTDALRVKFLDDRKKSEKSEGAAIQVPSSPEMRSEAVQPSKGSKEGPEVKGGQDKKEWWHGSRGRNNWRGGRWKKGGKGGRGKTAPSPNRAQGKEAGREARIVSLANQEKKT